MEDDGETRLAEGVHLPGFAEKFRARGNQQVLAVVGIDVGGKQALDGAGKAPVETVDEHGFENGSFKQYVGFSCRRIDGGSRNGGRIFCFLLSIFGDFPGIGVSGGGRNRTGLHVFQQLGDLRCVGSWGRSASVRRAVPRSQGRKRWPEVSGN